MIPLAAALAIVCCACNALVHNMSLRMSASGLKLLKDIDAALLFYHCY